MRRPFGLRGRLLVALLATSAVTLAAAALALLPALQDRLREQRADDLEAATLADVAAFEDAIGDSLRATRGAPESDRAFAVQQAVQPRALDLSARTAGARVIVTDSIPRQPPEGPVYDTDSGADFPFALVLRTLREQADQRVVAGDNVTVATLLATGDRRYVLVTQKPLTDVAAAVAQVRRAFLAAAGIGLLVALVLGVALAATLSRRLARLRAAALRVAADGADAPPPRDDGRDEVGDLARTLAAMQEALRRQEEARRTFVATASHELRTPLTSLSGTLELLQEDLRDGRLDVADAQDQLERAQGELRRLGRLATELLDLSRLDAAVPLRREPVELAELCRAVAAEFALRARERELEVVFRPPPGPCWGSGDPSAVARVVRILLDNALRHAPGGSAIRVAAAYHGEHATVEVADRGPGVAPEDRERIFERFERGRDASAGGGGFGLGLAIGRELARRMDGALELAADPDPAAPGARFVLRLPIELPAGSHPAEPAAEPLARR